MTKEDDFLELDEITWSSEKVFRTDIEYIRKDLYDALKKKQGYEQSEKDNALTIEDLELLHTFLYAVKNNKQGAFTFTRLSDEQYNEVLRRFKEAKK